MLLYQPKAGSIVKCDFKGFMEPEIVKDRPVIVIHAHKENKKLVTVVPISTVMPEPELYYHKKFELEGELKKYLKEMDRWFKCDLVYVVSLDRLNQLRNNETKTRGCPCVSNQVLNTVKEMARLSNGL